MEGVEENLVDIKSRLKSNSLTNRDKLILYSDSELLLIKVDKLLNSDLEEMVRLKTQSVKDELELISKSIKLGFVKRKRNVLLKLVGKVDEMVRMLAVWFFLAISSTLLALPCIFVKPLDYFLVEKGYIGPKYQLCNLCKCFISQAVIKLSGIDLIVESEADYFGKICALVCFSHASTMDAFILSATIPVRHYTLSKASLYLVPFFSWCLIAFGGIPIDRKNRDKAVKSIAYALSSAKMGDCVAMSPEGTRSKTGQLLPFKKGPFYLWEQLKTPIIPMVTYGAFDLYPPGKKMTIPGKVYVKFLTPIQPHEANTREEMSTLVRIRMLEALKNGPMDVGADISWGHRIKNILYLTSFYSFLFYICYSVYDWCTRNNVKIITFAYYWFMFTVGVTATIYIYTVYIVPMLESMRSSSNSSSNNDSKVDGKKDD